MVIGSALTSLCQSPPQSLAPKRQWLGSIIAVSLAFTNVIRFSLILVTFQNERTLVNLVIQKYCNYCTVGCSLQKADMLLSP
jgi:hypothetical protein